jgi:nitrite reductase/ring-hydroxylating ferredoxin subunit
MAETQVICTLDEIGDPGSRGFSLRRGDQVTQAFVVQRDGEVYAYHNRCPHTGAPLDWVEHRFLDLEQAYIQCATHDARFEIDSGVCITGPCPGASLQPIAIEVVGGQVRIAR